MEQERKIRVLMAKPGLDGHDRGAKVVGLALRNAGMEVIYTGLHRTVEEIVNVALQEDVDLIGLSVLSGAHLSITSKLMCELERKGLENVSVVVGGVIPEENMEVLRSYGVKAVFPVESSLNDIIETIKTITRSRVS